MSNNEQAIRDFVKAWSRLNVDEIVDYFTEDGVYHNMMLDPVKGKAALKGFIGAFIANWSDTEWELVNILSKGDIVVAERVDRTKSRAASRWRCHAVAYSKWKAARSRSGGTISTLPLSRRRQQANPRRPQAPHRAHRAAPRTPTCRSAPSA